MNIFREGLKICSLHFRRRAHKIIIWYVPLFINSGITITRLQNKPQSHANNLINIF